jgi:HD-GYP domain-containing protein (c-di-GMP phosphodiesterase class II)
MAVQPPTSLRTSQSFGGIAVAETFEMLVRDRPHRGARAFAVAGAEIQRWSGRIFDPRIVDVLLKVPDEDWQRASG